MMNQDAFRTLLSKPQQSGSLAAASSSRPKNLITGEVRLKPAQSGSTVQASFKPRKLKEETAKEPLRLDGDGDRTEGRVDFSEIQKMVEDIRHGTSLVKSHEPAVLAGDIDESLESAFESVHNALPQSAAGKKRTREDLVRELKEKRDDSKSVDAKRSPVPSSIPSARTVGKKGFKPIGQKEEKLPRKEDGEKRRKKRRKIDEDGKSTEKALKVDVQTMRMSTETLAPPQLDVNVGPFDEDIFAGAGDYEGYDLGSDEEAKVPGKEDGEIMSQGSAPPPAVAVKNWFNERPDSPPQRPVLPTKPVAPLPDEEQEDDVPMRLEPLASSALPSIREFLSLDAAEASRDTRKAKKEARRAKQGLGPSGDGDESDDDGRSKKKKAVLSKDAKLNRDYQRVSTYMEKKKGA